MTIPKFTDIICLPHFSLAYSDFGAAVQLGLFGYTKIALKGYDTVAVASHSVECVSTRIRILLKNAEKPKKSVVTFKTECVLYLPSVERSAASQFSTEYRIAEAADLYFGGFLLWGIVWERYAFFSETEIRPRA